MSDSRLGRRFRVMLKRHEIGITITLLLFCFAVVYFASSIFINIGAGEKGVLWSRLNGTVTDRVYPEGLHMIAPWDEMAIYNVRYQTVDQKIEVMSKDGLAIGVDVTIRYRPSDKQLGKLHQMVGPEYLKAVVLPEVGNAVRIVISGYRPDRLYTEGFSNIEDQIVDLCRQEIRDRFVLLDDVNIRDIELPLPVAEAIQRKLSQEQAALEMKYRLEREQQEAQRKKIEALGIKDFSDTAGAGLSAAYLRLKGIEATLELARSSNSKVIVIGSSSGGGIPMVFDADMFGVQGAGAAKAPATTAPR